MSLLWLVIRIIAYAIVLFNALLGDRFAMFIACLVFSTYFLLAFEANKSRG